MKNVTAVMLSKEPRSIALPGLAVLNHVSRFSDSAGLLDARLDAMHRVRTPYFFFLDDDDCLPPDYLAVIDDCVRQQAAIAYTDEVVHDRSMSQVRRSGPYDEDLFIEYPTLIHHLAICNTKAAHQAATEIPRGQYMFEMLMYFQLAKQGAAYVPRIGYNWVRRSDGLSRTPDILIGIVQSQTWAHRHRRGMQ